MEVNEMSVKQQEFLKGRQKHRIIVSVFRVLILLLFFILWEISSATGLIDSFIFSSPSKIVRCFWNMVCDRSIFLHVGVTVYETIVSFLLVIFIALLCAVLLWFSPKLSEIMEPYLVVLNSLPKSALAPLMARRHSNNDHCLWNVCCNLWKYFKPIYKLSYCRSRENQTHLYAARYQIPHSHKSCNPSLHSGNHQQYEGQHRTLPRRSDHRRIPCSTKRAWLLDHLLQPGL